MIKTIDKYVLAIFQAICDVVERLTTITNFSMARILVLFYFFIKIYDKNISHCLAIEKVLPLSEAVFVTIMIDWCDGNVANLENKVYAHFLRRYLIYARMMCLVGIFYYTDKYIFGRIDKISLIENYTFIFTFFIASCYPRQDKPN